MHRVGDFLALCETLNFSRAAETSNVAQPALTRAVPKLEEELGGLLLRREHLVADLTDFGRLVRPHPEQVMAEVEAAKSTRCTSFQMDNAPINHGRTDPLHELPRRVPGLASGCEVTLIEGYSGALRSSSSTAARSRGDGLPGTLHRPDRDPPAVPRAVLRRVPYSRCRSAFASS